MKLEPKKISESHWQDTCLHNKCSECNGTGRKKNGEQCVHYISCRCARCSPRMHISRK